MPLPSRALRMSSAGAVGLHPRPPYSARTGASSSFAYMQPQATTSGGESLGGMDEAGNLGPRPQTAIHAGPQRVRGGNKASATGPRPRPATAVAGTSLTNSLGTPRALKLGKQPATPLLRPALDNLAREMKSLYALIKQLQKKCRWVVKREQMLNDQEHDLNRFEAALIQNHKEVEALAMNKLATEGQYGPYTMDKLNVQALNEWVRKASDRTRKSKSCRTSSHARGAGTKPPGVHVPPDMCSVSPCVSTTQSDSTNGKDEDELFTVAELDPESYSVLLRRLEAEMRNLQQTSSQADDYEREVQAMQRGAERFVLNLMHLSQDLSIGSQAPMMEDEQVTRLKRDLANLRGLYFDLTIAKERAEENERVAYQRQKSAEALTEEAECKAREAYLIQRRLEVEVNLLRSERTQIDQQVHNMEVRIRSLDHRNSELKVIIDRATCKGGLLHTFNQLEEANARVLQLQQENQLLQHHLNMERAEGHARLLLAAEATASKQAELKANEEIALANKAVVVAQSELKDAQNELEDLKVQLGTVESMAARMHRKLYGDSTMQELTKNSARQRMELLIRQLALVQLKCDKHKFRVENQAIQIATLQDQVGSAQQAMSDVLFEKERMQLQHKAETNAVYDEAAFLRDRNRALNKKLYQVDLPDQQVDLNTTAGSLDGTSYALPVLRNDSIERYATSSERLNQLESVPTTNIKYRTDPLSPEQEICHELHPGIDQSNPHEGIDPDQWVGTAVSTVHRGIQPISEDQGDEHWSHGASSPVSEEGCVELGHRMLRLSTAPHTVNGEGELQRSAQETGKDMTELSISPNQESVDGPGLVSNQRVARRKKGKTKHTVSNHSNVRNAKRESTETKDVLDGRDARNAKRPGTPHETSVVELVDNPLRERTM